MNRYPVRICGENLYHHIYAWGNDRNSIFKSAYHFQTYLNLLENLSKKFTIDIIAYALMEWHIHLFIFDQLNKISEFMENLHGKYALFFNKNTGRVGHVFGERYNNIIVQPNKYGIWLSRYIHRQAVEPGIVVDPKDYPWTSYRQYIGLEPIKFIKPEIILEQFGDNIKNPEEVAKRYQNFINDIDKEDTTDWDNAKSGIIGDSDYLRDLFKKLKINEPRIIDKESLLKDISKELEISVEQLLKPQGLEEKKLRRRAINILIKKHKIKIIDVAQILKISRFTVMKNMD